MDVSEERLTRLTRSLLKSTTFPISHGRATIVEEIRTLQGRPDIVVMLNGGSSRSQTIRRAGAAMASHTAAAILAHMHSRRSVRIDKLVPAVYATKRSVSYAIDRLINARLIQERQGLLRKLPLLEELSVPIWAIEVKRKLSQRALFQAQQYRSFASRSLIVCWDNDSIYDLLAGRLRRSYLGVVTIDDAGAMKVIRRGRSTAPRNLVAYYYALGSARAGNTVVHSGFAIK